VCCGGEWGLGSGLQTLFSYSSLLPFQELVGWCQPGGLQNVSPGNLRHITPRVGFCLCIYPARARTLKLERRFLPYYCNDSEENVSQVKAFPPLRSGWPETPIQTQRIVRRCKRRDSQLFSRLCEFWALGEAEKVNLSIGIHIPLSMCGQI
jgi:hypothetical protein